MQIFYKKLLEWLHANWTKFFSVKTTQQLHDHFMTVAIYHTYMKDISTYSCRWTEAIQKSKIQMSDILFLHIRKVLSRKIIMWIFMNECCISSIQIASSVRNFCRLTHTQSLKVINYLLKIMMNELFKTAEQTELMPKI